MELSVGQVNLILAALGEMPYREVYALIEVIHEQAASQIERGPSEAEAEAEAEAVE
ncbi:MAG: hypothetical protein QOG64_1527 [Acidimicrobiaceae bacterium]|nr:hypothetical protein [Acidimicrobiaceae bacterium]